MKLSNPIEQDGLIEEITRITGATISVYTNKARISRLNNALDKYWVLASDSAPKGTFDDVNNASIPVETQSIVAGTNAYKVGTFTNEILQILRVAVLKDDGTEMDLSREEFDDISEFNETYSTDTEDRGVPNSWTKMGDYIYLNPCPDYSETNGLRAYVNRELSKFAFTTFTTTHASDLFNATAHGLVANDAIIVETDGTISSGMTADTVVYYVISSGLTDDAFKVSLTIGGSTITLASDGTGNHKFTKVNKIPGIPVIHHDYLARQASLPFLIEKKLEQASSIAQSVAQDRQDIMDYWQSRGRELSTIIKPNRRLYK